MKGLKNQSGDKFYKKEFVYLVGIRVFDLNEK